MRSATLLSMQNVSKEFPGVLALSNINFTLKRSEVHALIGENGAGKSTLIKILSGVYKQDTGKIFIESKRAEIRNPIDAIRLGISTIYQETALVGEITVAENIFLGRQPSRAGRLLWKEMYGKASEILASLSIDIAPQSIVGNLSSARQQLVEIAKAFSHRSKILIMDEPTAAITDTDTENLFQIIRKLIKEGTAVIYISHRLKEVFEIADRVTVLRDGKWIITKNVADTDTDELVKFMVGREIDNLYGYQSYEPKEKVVLRVENLSRRKLFTNISFDLKEGEILGFSGLVGARRSDIVRAIFGLEQIDGGEIYIDGSKVHIRDTTDAINSGIAFVSEDRRTESVIQGFSVRRNLTLLLLREMLNRIGLLDVKKEREFARRSVDKFSIKTPSVEQLVRNLSGGNQQKVALAKCLSTNPKVMILDEPTKGIDVGAKKEIHELIKELARSGMSIIVVSSELPEIIGICHSVIVIREGRIAKQFSAGQITEENLMHAAVGNI